MRATSKNVKRVINLEHHVVEVENGKYLKKVMEQLSDCKIFPYRNKGVSKAIGLLLSNLIPCATLSARSEQSGQC